MSVAFRASFYFLALGFGFFIRVLTGSQPAPSTLAAEQSNDEASLRPTAEAFFSLAASGAEGDEESGE
jgi:hypothetical protein